MQIIPMRDLKNTVEIEKKCQNGPVFVTKNGYGKLVVMNLDFVNEGIADFTKGNIKDGNEIIKEIKGGYEV